MTKFNRRVFQARVNLNYEELSRLGKKGAEARRIKAKAEKAREEAIAKAKRALFLSGAREMLREANEDICPIDD